jgi:hypothetical protein
LITLAELFEGRSIDFPHVTGADVTLKSSPKSKRRPRAIQQDAFANDPFAGTALSRELAKSRSASKPGGTSAAADVRKAPLMKSVARPVRRRGKVR